MEKYDSQKDFTSLDAWKKARLIKLFFYSEVVPLLPVEEKFNLNLQIRKASISGTANIAEGYGRYHIRKDCNFTEYQEDPFMN
jgi:four helix bundle protein